MKVQTTLCLLFLLPLVSSAQSTWIVDRAGGPGHDFLQIQAAIDVASDGDTIVVRAGSYDGISISQKSLTITNETGATPLLLPLPGAFMPAVSVAGLASNQSVVVRGLVLRHSFTTAGGYLISLGSNAGVVWLEDCDILTTPLGQSDHVGALRTLMCDAVVLSRCALFGSLNSNNGAPIASPGAFLEDSNVAMYDSSLVGCQGGDAALSVLAQVGGPGMRILNSTVFASGCSIHGGDGGSVQLGQTAVDGGTGLEQFGSSNLTLLDTTLVGGAGGSGNGTPPGLDGAPLDLQGGVVSVVSGSAKSAELQSPIRPAIEPLTETFTGNPGDVVLLGYSLAGPTPPIFLAIVRGSLVLSPPLIVQTKGVCDANGELVTTPTLPPLGAGAPSQTIFLQGAMVGPQGITLTAPTTLTLLAN